ncbi:MAG: PAS domain S-box protein [Pseudomonadota bacterium]
MDTRTSDAPFRSRPLGASLAMAFFFLSALSLLVFSSVKTYSDFKSLENILLSRQQLVAQDAARMVSGFLNENFSILEAAIWLTDLDSKPGADQKTIIQGLLGLCPGFRRLALLDPERRLLAQASRLSLEGSRRAEELPQGLGSGPDPLADRSIGPVFFDLLTAEPMVVMSVPVKDVFGDAKGVLIGELNLKSMFELVEQITVGRSGYAYVVDRAGNLLAFFDSALVIQGKKVNHLNTVAAFIHSPASQGPESGVRYRGLRGTTVLGAYAPLVFPDWAVVSELPWREAYQDVSRNVVLAGGVTLLMALVAGACGLVMARRLSYPVKKLTETASRIAAGERDLQAEAAGPREVAHLAGAFNSMTAQLRRSLAEAEDRYAETERTKEALRVNEERLRLALEGTSDGIWDWNILTGDVYFSPRYYVMVGYEPGEFPGCYESWQGLLHPDDRERSERVVREAVENKTGFVADFRFKTKDGGWRWILARGKVVDVGPSGAPMRMAGSHTDITEQKRTEDALRKYERIVSVSQDFMAIVNGDYVFEAVNDSMLLALGKERDEVLGRGLPQIVGEALFQEKVKPRLDLAWTGRQVTFEETYDFRGPRRRTLDVTYLPIRDETGRVEGLVLNARDITENRKLQEQLVQSQKMESIGALASGVAHEINNPINGVMNYAQLIIDRVEPESSTAELAREIILETERVAGIVRNLLTFARDEKQSHSLALASDIVSSSLSLIQTVMRHDQIDLQVDVPDNLPAIKCRSQQIRQVVMNLMTNARDALNQKFPGYNPEKKLLVSARPQYKSGREFIRITVEDHGVGISPGIRDRIFDPFFTTKPKDLGTGLGLSITYGIVRDHGGELIVESEPDRFTRIHVDLPVDNGWLSPGERGNRNG